MALDGPLKPLVDAGLDMNKVIVRILPIAEAIAEYEKATGMSNTSWGLGGVALVRPYLASRVWNGQAEVVVSEGILPQVMPNLVREISGAYYMIKNTSGWNAGAKVGAHELFLHISEVYAYNWFAENGIFLGGNISYETNKLAYDVYLESPDPFGNLNQCLWALSADLGYPDGGVPSSVLLQQMMDIVNMPDPTDFANKLLAEAEKLDKTMIKSKAYWNSMVDTPRTMLPLDVCRVIDYPSTSAVFSLDAVKAAQDGPTLAIR
jgi:hypothetical protein